MHLFVAVLYDWWIPRIWHEISAFLFCSFGFQILSKSSVPVFFFCFQKNFDALYIVTWTWSHWCRIIFYFYHSLSWMLYLPCTKRYYSETYCLKGILIFWYNYILLLELMVAGLSLLFYVCWFVNQMDGLVSEWWVFTERSFRAERNLSFAWEWKICFSLGVLCFSVRGSDSRVPAPSPA